MTADLLKLMRFNAYPISPSIHGVCSVEESSFFVANAITILELLTMIILLITLHRRTLIPLQAMKFQTGKSMISEFVHYSLCPLKAQLCSMTHWDKLVLVRCVCQRGIHHQQSGIFMWDYLYKGFPFLDLFWVCFRLFNCIEQ